MKEFFVEDFKNTSEYENFVNYMLMHSDFFTLVYFRYRENEKMRQSTKIIYNSLKKYKLHSEYTKRWPNTETKDDEHIYKIVFYRSDPACQNILIRVKDLLSWDYPNAPMDLCFYKNGYCWLAVTAHERFACLYVDNDTEIKELESIGTELTLSEESAEVFRYNMEFINKYLR